MRPLSQLIRADILVLPKGPDLDQRNLLREDVYSADLIISGHDKILKNRWGKPGTIVDSYQDLLQEECYKILLEIFNEVIIKKEREMICNSFPSVLIKKVGSVF